MFIVWALAVPGTLIFWKCLPKLHWRFFTFVFFGVWIWMFLLWYLFTMILGLTDIYYQSNHGIPSVGSFVIACFYVFLCLCVPIIIFLSFVVFWKRIPNTIVAEYFSGIKLDRIGCWAFYNISQCIWKIGYALLIMSC